MVNMDAGLGIMMIICLAITIATVCRAGEEVEKWKSYHKDTERKLRKAYIVLSQTKLELTKQNTELVRLRNENKLLKEVDSNGRV